MPGSAATPPARDSAGAAQRRAGPGRALSSSLLTALTALTFSLGVLQHRLHEAALVRLKGELDRDGRSSELITNPSSRPSTSPTSPSSSKSPSSPVRKGRGKKAAAQQSALEQLCTDLTAMVAQGEIDPSHPTLPQPTLPHSSLSHHQPAAQQSALEQFCTDLTAMAVQGGIDPVIGREEEVARVIPAHRTSNNQLLLGEPGVGKTALDPCSSHREQPSAAGRARGGKTAISPFSMPLFVLSSPLSLFHSPALLSCSLPPQIQARRTKNNPLLLGELGVGKTAMYSPLFTQPLPPVSHLPILAFSPSPPPQILARCTKNNPLLLGEPGVGKTAIAEGLALRIAENDVPPFLQVRGHVAGVEMGTAIAEGLALRIAENDVPPFLQVSGVVLRREWVDRGTGCIAKGLGKAAVGEGLAGKRLRSLDMGRVMAGAKERGELELRVTMLVAEAEAVAAAGEVILLIDEVHTMVGAGAGGRGRDGGGSGLDISNLLKPALSRGQIQLEPQEGDEAGGGSASDISNLLKTALTRGKIQCISTTTTNEFCEHLEKDKALASHLMHSHLPPPSPPARLHSNPSLTHLLLLNHQCIATTTTNEFCKHLEKDKALARRFQPVTVDEPSEEAALAILHGLRHLYEAHHKCTLTDDTLAAAVTLYACFIPDRCLPDRAIDLIDKAASRSRVEGSKGRRRRASGVLERGAEEYWREIRMAQAAHEAVRMGAMRASKREACRSKVEGSKGRRRRVSGVLERGAEEYWREIRMAQAAHEACGSRAAGRGGGLPQSSHLIHLFPLPLLVFPHSSSVTPHLFPCSPFSLALLLLRSLAPVFPVSVSSHLQACACWNPSDFSLLFSDCVSLCRHMCTRIPSPRFTSFLFSRLTLTPIPPPLLTPLVLLTPPSSPNPLFLSLFHRHMLARIPSPRSPHSLSQDHVMPTPPPLLMPLLAAGRSKSGITGSDKEDGTTAADAATAAGQSRSGITGSDKDDSPTEITAEHIAAVAAHWTGIPLQQLSLSDQQHLAGLEEALETRVVGQGGSCAGDSTGGAASEGGVEGGGEGRWRLCCSRDLPGWGKRSCARHWQLTTMDRPLQGGAPTESASSLQENMHLLMGIGGEMGAERDGRMRGGQYAAMREVVMEELKVHFRPELMNRIDVVVVFRALERGTAQVGRYAAMRDVVVEELKMHFRPALMNWIDEVVVFRALERGTAMREMVVEELKGHFRPELINRIDEVVVFRTFEKEQVSMQEARLCWQRGKAAATPGTATAASASSDLSESLPSVPSVLLPAIAADAKEDDTSAPLGDVSGVREGAFTAGDTALVDVGEDGEPVVIRLPRPDVCEMGLCLPFLKLPAAAAPTLRDAFGRFLERKWM
ncbi:unnamed protein product [Closterium sp. Naga37s-1]|nr:unnamed protein product [Closterium sp. Naga37s-1]